MQEKLAKFTKILNYTKSLMYNFVCQNVLMFPYCLQDELTYFGLRFLTHSDLEMRGQLGIKSYK